MAVGFIIGRSGTGKTRYCVSGIIEALLDGGDVRPLILLVPEQATYQAERAILGDARIAGYSSGAGARLNVLSFERLAFLLSGGSAARPSVSRTGQQMIIQRILRENRDRLKIFGGSAEHPGLGRQIADTIRELHKYAKDVEDIEQLLGQLQKQEGELTALKFADIALVLNEYLKFIEGRFVDDDVRLVQVCAAVGKAGFVKGARLWVDGFAGFTGSELMILAELLKAASETQIALCLDKSAIDVSKAADPTSMFYPTQRTYAELVEIVRRCKLKLATPVVLHEAVRFSGSAELKYIEGHVFENEPARIKATENVRIVSAPNARAEVRWVAREVVRLVRERGYRYRDIAVIASDIDGYEHYVRASFEDYDLPFFIDKRKGLNHHPVVQLVYSALRTVTGGFAGGDIFAYLKTDLVPIERGDVDLLENYCLAFGVTGSDWQTEKAWQFAGGDAGFDEQRINKIREKVRRPLLGLRDKLCAGEDIDADKFVRAVFDLLEELDVRETIGEWVEQAIRRNDHGAADEHRQFYEKLVSILDELVEVFGGQEMSCADYFAILNSAFSQMTLAFIPPSLDQVLVGSIERSRHPDLKAVFLIGATQKQFPVAVGSSSILTDADRKAAEATGFELGATTNQKLIERRYLAYIAFTRASEYLCVTYPAIEDKGGAAVRSEFAGDIEKLFENLKAESIVDEQDSIDRVCCADELADLLCEGLGPDSDANESEFAQLLDDICADEELGEIGSRVARAIDYDNGAQLDADVVAELFGQRLKSSATRLGAFAACPYKYFARYTLGLQKRAESKFEPLDVGNFYHCVLDGLVRQVKEKKKDFRDIEEDELVGILSEQVSKLMAEDAFIANFKRRSAHNSFIIDSAGEVLEDFVRAMREIVRAGRFEPILSEAVFGKSGEGLGEYKLRLPDGRELFLRGKIDRVDIANVDGRKLAMVFDYKRRDKSFSWAKFYHGLDIQLPVYMLAVRRTGAIETDVVGAFYMPVEIGAEKASLNELSKKVGNFSYKAKGIFDGEYAECLDGVTGSGASKFYNYYITKDGEPYGHYGTWGALRLEDFEKVLAFAEKRIVELAGETVSGKIDVSPYRLGTDSPCDFCDYKSVCRFDWQINSYNFMESLGKAGVLERIETVER